MTPKQRVIRHHGWKRRLVGYFDVATCQKCGAETVYILGRSIWTDFPTECPGTVDEWKMKPCKSPFAMREAEREDS